MQATHLLNKVREVRQCSHALLQCNSHGGAARVGYACVLRHELSYQSHVACAESRGTSKS